MTSPVLYHRVTPSDRLAPDAFEDRRGGEVPLAEPLLVQSPVVMLASSVADGLPHAHLALPPAFAAWARDVEAAVLQAALARREDWFEGPSADDRAVVAAFKQLCKASGHLKVALPSSLEAFDAAGELLEPGSLGVGDEVRCILRLDAVAIGRTEFGAMWTLVQAQTRPAPPPPPRCLLAPEDERSQQDASTTTEPQQDEFL